MQSSFGLVVFGIKAIYQGDRGNALIDRHIDVVMFMNSVDTQVNMNL